jgi:hypothetical protein
MTIIMRILTDLFPVRRPVSRLRAARRHTRVPGSVSVRVPAEALVKTCTRRLRGNADIPEGHGPALVTRLFLSLRDGVPITDLAGALG